MTTRVPIHPRGNFYRKLTLRFARIVLQLLLLCSCRVYNAFRFSLCSHCCCTKTIVQVVPKGKRKKTNKQTKNKLLFPSLLAFPQFLLLYPYAFSSPLPFSLHNYFLTVPIHMIEFWITPKFCTCFVSRIAIGQCWSAAQVARL